MSKAGIAVFALSALLTGCSGGWVPWGSSDKEQPRRLPDGATDLQCAQNKRLVVKYSGDGKSVWVLFPDREFRLDRVATSSTERYTNGPTSLTVESDGIALDVDGARQYAGCSKKQ